MTNTTAWEEYCEASLDLSNQDDVGELVEEPPTDESTSLDTTRTLSVQPI